MQFRPLFFLFSSSSLRRDSHKMYYIREDTHQTSCCFCLFCNNNITGPDNVVAVLFPFLGRFPQKLRRTGHDGVLCIITAGSLSAAE